ncbi:monocarboxylate transporter 12-B-like [Argiope bruennichi]|uniref:monocarboxylate transporter 12-B-like n=1 Tax=Argiope bruennichi TaxID=94029 RepID=UPI0024947778|nr:monocarboxylate transporter 12-B-like [Argiope bruennichi]
MVTKMKKAPGPDQAKGWVIAMACFWINFIMLGLARTAGVLYVALIELYGVSREAATTPFSIRVCVRNFTGPLIGILGLKYGVRISTAVGGFIAAMGGILCFFAPDVFWITVFWGIIHGVGFGMSTLIHMVTINHYFDKYKASALGLGYSGDCFGTFTFPVILEYLLSNYGVRGTFLILGGIVLNVIPMALLLRKPSWIKANKKEGNFTRNIAQQTAMDTKLCKGALQSGGCRNEGFMEHDEKTLRDIIALESLDNGFAKECSPPVSQDNEKPKVRISNIDDVSSVRSLICSSRKTSDDSDGMLKPTSCIINQMPQETDNKMRSASFTSLVQDGFINKIELEQNDDFEIVPETLPNKVCQEIPTGLQSGKEVDIIQKNNIQNQLTLSVKEQNLNVDIKDQTFCTSEEITKKPSIINTFIRTNAKPIFILISVSMAVYAFLFVGVVTVIIDYAVDQGVSHENGKYLIIAFSVADLIGRLSFGQIIDRKLIKIKNFSGFTMLFMGILIAAIPFNKSFTYMLAIICAYGLIQGGTAIMFPILVSHYMDKSEESVAMGCLNFYGGFLMLCLAPMIGFFRDNTGSYNGVFHILGGLVAVVGLAWQLEPLLLKCQTRQTSRNADSDTTSKL